MKTGLESSNDLATNATRRRYQRMAPFYDWTEMMTGRHQQPWRERLWSLVRGGRILEVGVGTGRNIALYPKGARVTAIDLTPGMLERAERRAQALGIRAELRLGDVQQLDFPDERFDTVVATCVFCSVPDPVLGLSEVLRVTRSGGQVLLLEHVRPEQPLLAALMDLVNPLVHLIGPNINRPTVENVRRAGLQIERVESLGMGGIFKLIEARRVDDTPRQKVTQAGLRYTA